MKKWSIIKVVYFATLGECEPFWSGWYGCSTRYLYLWVAVLISSMYLPNTPGLNTERVDDDLIENFISVLGSYGNYPE